MSCPLMIQERRDFLVICVACILKLFWGEVKGKGKKCSSSLTKEVSKI